MGEEKMTVKEKLEVAIRALQKIAEHQKIVCPSGVHLSATWNIAVAALNVIEYKPYVERMSEDEYRDWQDQLEKEGE